MNTLKELNGIISHRLSGYRPREKGDVERPKKDEMAKGGFNADCNRRFDLIPECKYDVEKKANFEFQ
jgi:hypothetical protein